MGDLWSHTFMVVQINNKISFPNIKYKELTENNIRYTIDQSER